MSGGRWRNCEPLVYQQFVEIHSKDTKIKPINSLSLY